MVQQDFAVHKRGKPADYVYTPTEQKTLLDIQRQIGDLADLTTEAKENLVAAINEVARMSGSESMALRVSDGYVQYSTDGGSTWKNLIAVAELKDADGAPGKDGVTPTIGSNGNWYLGATDTGKPSRGETGPQGTPGKDGVNGETGPAGPAGPQGHAGAPGKDGAPGAPGAQGEKGEKGEKGDPGTPGAAGHTPVKGTDYWTAADKQEIVNNVLAALPDGTEVSY